MLLLQINVDHRVAAEHPSGARRRETEQPVVRFSVTANVIDKQAQCNK